LPGVQILSAFLLTAPFSQRFTQLDHWERTAYGVALMASMLSVLCLLAPTLLHRMGDRTARADRLHWGIRLQVSGLVLLAVALVSALWSIAHFVYGAGVAWTSAILFVVLIAACWVALPRALHRR
jgi:hypothetical protein